MLKFFDHVLEAKGFGWTILRFLIVATPAALVLIVTSYF